MKMYVRKDRKHQRERKRKRGPQKKKRNKTEYQGQRKRTAEKENRGGDASGDRVTIRYSPWKTCTGADSHCHPWTTPCRSKWILLQELQPA